MGKQLAGVGNTTQTDAATTQDEPKDPSDDVKPR